MSHFMISWYIQDKGFPHHVTSVVSEFLPAALVCGDVINATLEDNVYFTCSVCTRSLLILVVQTSSEYKNNGGTFVGMNCMIYDKDVDIGLLLMS